MRRWSLRALGWPSLGMFGRTYVLVLGSVLFAEAVIFGTLMVAFNSLPPVAPYVSLIDRLAGRDVVTAMPFDVREAASPPIGPPQAGSDAALLAMIVADDLGVPRDRVRAELSRVGPPATFGVQTADNVRRGARPILIAGDFTVAVEQPGGGWRIIATDGRFARQLQWRLLFMLAGTLSVVAPFAWLIARRMTAPIRDFATAADSYSGSTTVPSLPEYGPPELRTAIAAFNAMQERIGRHIEERTTALAAIAHDLRSPLMRIALHADDMPEERRMAVMTQISEMRQMIEEALEYLRYEHSSFEFSPVDLTALIKATADDFAPYIALADPFQQANVAGHAPSLRRLFSNLFENARKFAGEAQVSIAADADGLTVEVVDNGPGVSESERSKLTLPFYRAEGSRNRATGGTGLGLSIVKSIAEAHGAALSFPPKKDGGFRVMIRWPGPAKP
jgi:two-component system, OmpR family, sensor kinase